jgi:hypothetical protein
VLGEVDQNGNINWICNPFSETDIDSKTFLTVVEKTLINRNIDYFVVFEELQTKHKNQKYSEREVLITFLCDLFKLDQPINLDEVKNVGTKIS